MEVKTSYGRKDLNIETEASTQLSKILIENLNTDLLSARLMSVVTTELNQSKSSQAEAPTLFHANEQGETP